MWLNKKTLALLIKRLLSMVEYNVFFYFIYLSFYFKIFLIKFIPGQSNIAHKVYPPDFLYFDVDPIQHFQFISIRVGDIPERGMSGVPVAILKFETTAYMFKDFLCLYTLRIF